MDMSENTCKGQKDVPSPRTNDSHVSLSAEPLLASTAVLDVLEHFRKHGALQALLLSRLLEVIIGSGTWGWKKHPDCNDNAELTERFPD